MDEAAVSLISPLVVAFGSYGLAPNRPLLQIAYVHADPMQVVFHSTHLTFEEWFKVVLAGAFVFAWRKRSFAASAEAPLLSRLRRAGAIV